MESKCPHIVIIEGNPTRAEAMCRVLLTSGWNGEIDVVHTLRDYHTIVSVRTPDVALVGLHLPDGEAADSLVLPPETDPFPILITADPGDERAAEEALRAGAIDFVIDSGSFADLYHAVERTLRLWKLLQACRASDAFVSRISDSISDNVFITNFTGTIMEVNEACCLTLGHRRKDLLGMNLSLILSQEDVATILSLRESEEKRGFPLGLRAADGRTIPVVVSVHKLTYRGKGSLFCTARREAGIAGAKEEEEESKL